MDIQAHKRTLGILHIIYGSLIVIVFLFVVILGSTFIPFIEEVILEEEGREGLMIINMVSSVIGIVITVAFIIAAFCIIGGIGLLQKKQWGLITTLIAGCIIIFSFPFGTALGAYTLYVFANSNKKIDDKDQG